MWRLQTTLSESVCHERAGPGVNRWRNETLVGQVSKLNLTAPGPLALLADDQNEWIVEQDLHIEVFTDIISHKIIFQSGQDQINLALVKLWHLHGRLSHLLHFKFDTRILTGEAFKNRQQESRRDRFRTSDPQLACKRIGDEFNVLDSLVELVESSSASHQQRFAVAGRNDAFRASIKKSYAERMLQRGNDL